MGDNGIMRTVTRVEAMYEVPVGYTEDDVEEAVLGSFGSTIDSSFVEVVDGKRWVVTGGEPGVIDVLDTAYLTWRNELAGKGEL